MLIWTGKDIFGSGKEWAQNGLVYLVRVIIAEKDSLHNSAKYLVAVSHPWPNRWLSFMAVHSWDRYTVSPLLLIFINRCGFFSFFLSGSRNCWGLHWYRCFHPYQARGSLSLHSKHPDQSSGNNVFPRVWEPSADSYQDHHDYRKLE